VSFLLLQVTVVLTVGRERKGRRKQARSTHFRALPAVAARGEDAPQLFMQIPDDFPVVPVIFWELYFVILGLLRFCLGNFEFLFTL
jgi:hypothetical protein